VNYRRLLITTRAHWRNPRREPLRFTRPRPTKEALAEFARIADLMAGGTMWMTPSYPVIVRIRTQYRGALLSCRRRLQGWYA
jgi:hypothetical protein